MKMSFPQIVDIYSSKQNGWHAMFLNQCRRNSSTCLKIENICLACLYAFSNKLLLIHWLERSVSQNTHKKPLKSVGHFENLSHKSYLFTILNQTEKDKQFEIKHLPNTPVETLWVYDRLWIILQETTNDPKT